ncbi:hypothetical protein Tcan_00265 [Toxocara canis]|uniref:Uncharacterized protein n=1 Tax=Toxocara canis TaxID=6265 RepID=A0A0B2VWT1_TOXCA|nr:hypothetical protein Tcan_00265 [Toxocara canis]
MLRKFSMFPSLKIGALSAFTETSLLVVQYPSSTFFKTKMTDYRECALISFRNDPLHQGCARISFKPFQFETWQRVSLRHRVNTHVHACSCPALSTMEPMWKEMRMFVVFSFS